MWGVGVTTVMTFIKDNIFVLIGALALSYMFYSNHSLSNDLDSLQDKYEYSLEVNSDLNSDIKALKEEIGEFKEQSEENIKIAKNISGVISLSDVTKERIANIQPAAREDENEEDNVAGIDGALPDELIRVLQ